MGHPPPSPASTIDGLVQLERYMNTTAGASHQTPPEAPGEVVQSYAPPHHPRYQTTYHGYGFAAYHQPCGHPHQQQQDEHIPSAGYPGADGPAGGLYGMTNGQACHYGYTHPPYTPETSPPARPTAENVISTRSGRSIARRPCLAEPRRAKRPRAEKKAEQPTDETGPDFVKKPLSEMSKEMPDVVVYDVGTYAHRPVSVRQQEAVEQGKVKRPLNDFVLYRKAYIDVVKARFMPGEKTINQQRVSRICGDSWKMEVPEIKSKFKELSNMERDKHGQAFPKYKYAPKQGKKQKGDDTSKPAQGKPSTRASARGASRRPATSSSSSLVRGRGQFSYGGFPEAAGVGALPQQQGLFGGDAYWCSPGMQPLVPVCGAGHAQAQAQLNYPGHHDMYPMPEFSYTVGQMIKEEASPAGNYVTNLAPPMGPNLEGFSDPCLDLCIDPSLLPRAGKPLYQYMPRDDPLNAHRAMRDGGDMMAAMPDLDVDGAHNAYLRGGQDDCQVEHFDETSHFNDWMAQEEHTRI
ncbi:Transcription factor ste11 [Tolypocladium ophioglossoides CBS 100239]|uniref:Transcription factor ste11 n=1 Tax=Tolypocladium ophioglossoides (strain CBS 100239) TaxID=1163406 RepID=A0A0L0N8M7_TOLOC|nr:Transcription factor ste11 [Tolypocladium ophioglossoides CBS 100239]